MAGIDILLNASVDAMKRSGAIENNMLMATVSVVNAGGTLDVTRVGDTIPSVRRLTSYTSPVVGDLVLIQRATGGWICLGKLATS